MGELAPGVSRFFLRRLGLISERDDVQKFFGKKDEKTPIIGATQKMIKIRNLNEIKMNEDFPIGRINDIKLGEEILSIFIDE